MTDAEEGASLALAAKASAGKENELRESHLGTRTSTAGAASSAELGQALASLAQTGSSDDLIGAAALGEGARSSEDETSRLLSPAHLLDRLQQVAMDAGSAGSKTRALLASAMLQRGEPSEAAPLIHQAAETSPRSALCAVFARKLAAQDDSPSQAQAALAVSEASLVQADAKGAQAATARALLRGYSQAADPAPTRRVLEKVARLGAHDSSWGLLRTIQKLAMGESIAGLRIDDDMLAFAELTQEVLVGATPPAGEHAPEPDVVRFDRHLLRAARAFERADAKSGLALLEDTTVAKETRLHLNAAFSRSKSGGTRRAAELYKELATRDARPDVIRCLASAAVQIGDSSLLAWALAQADPAAGCFNLQERALLAACSGEQLRSGFGQQSPSPQDRALSLCLAPATEIAIAPEASSEEALLVQLGTTLTALPAELPPTEIRSAVTSEFAKRGLENELVTALGLGEALLAEVGPGLLDALSDMLTAWEEPRGPFIEALATEKVLGNRAALTHFQATLEEGPELAEACIRALVECAPQEAISELDLLAKGTEHPYLKWCYEQELALREKALAKQGNVSSSQPLPEQEPPPESGIEVAPEDIEIEELGELDEMVELDAGGDEEEVSEVAPGAWGPGLEVSRSLVATIELAENWSRAGPVGQSEKTSRDEESLPEDIAATLLVLQARAAQIQAEPAGEGVERARELLSDSASTIAHRSRFRDAWTADSPPSPQELDSWAASADVSERALAYFWGTAKLGEGETSGRRQLEALSTFVDQGLFGDRNHSLAIARSLAGEFPELAAVFEDLCLVLGQGQLLSPGLLETAKNGSTPGERRHAYERLFEIDQQLGQVGAATLWLKAICDEFVGEQQALLQLEEQLLLLGESTDHVQQTIAANLAFGDRESYQLVAGAHKLARFDHRGAAEALRPLLKEKRTPYSALIGLRTVAEERRDDELLVAVCDRLFQAAEGHLDQHSLALSVAYALCRLGQRPLARHWASRATEQQDGAFSALLLQFALMQEDQTAAAPDDSSFEEQARMAENLGRSARDATHQREFFSLAARHWEAADHRQQAKLNYQKALEAEPADEHAFNRLHVWSIEEEDWESQRALLESRLEHVPPSTQKALDHQLELTQLLRARGQNKQALVPIESALAHHPHSKEALALHFDLCIEEQRFEAAESSLLALKRLLEPGNERTKVLRRLAKLYHEDLSQLERAMDAHQAVLEVEPKDEAVRQTLVDIYTSLGFADRAADLQTQIIFDATSEESKRSGALKLAAIYEQVGHDQDRAWATLERTRKAWPLSSAVLRASIEFMDRRGGGVARAFILDRTAKGAERRLKTGNLEPQLFETLAEVAHLRGKHQQEDGCRLALAALSGDDHQALEQGAEGAFAAELEELLAPRQLPTPLRTLLRNTGAAMDSAFTLDTASLGAQRLMSGSLLDRANRWSRLTVGVESELFSAASLASLCVPITARPLRILVDDQFAELPGESQDFLLLRALKLQEMGAGALFRQRPADRWPQLAALFSVFVPEQNEPTVDPKKVAQFRALIEQGFSRAGYEGDVPTLVLEAIGALAGNGKDVGAALPVVANRVALLATGNLSAALSGLAAGQDIPLASGGPARIESIHKDAQMRDLLLFAASDAFARARERFRSNNKPAAPSPIQASLPPPLPAHRTTREGRSRAPLPPPRRPNKPSS